MDRHVPLAGGPDEQRAEESIPLRAEPAHAAYTVTTTSSSSSSAFHGTQHEPAAGMSLGIPTSSFATSAGAYGPFRVFYMRYPRWLATLACIGTVLVAAVVLDALLLPTPMDWAIPMALAIPSTAGWVMGSFSMVTWPVMAACALGGMILSFPTVYNYINYLDEATSQSYGLLLLAMIPLSVACWGLCALIFTCARMVLFYAQACSGVPIIMGGRTSSLPWPGDTAPPTWWPHTGAKKITWGFVSFGALFFLSLITSGASNQVPTIIFLFLAMLCGPFCWTLLGWLSWVPIPVLYSCGMFMILISIDTAGILTLVGVYLFFAASFMLIGTLTNIIILWHQARSWEEGATIYVPLSPAAYPLRPPGAPSSPDYWTEPMPIQGTFGQWSQPQWPAPHPAQAAGGYSAVAGGYAGPTGGYGAAAGAGYGAIGAPVGGAVGGYAPPQLPQTAGGAPGAAGGGLLWSVSHVGGPGPSLGGPQDKV